MTCSRSQSKIKINRFKPRPSILNPHLPLVWTGKEALSQKSFLIKSKTHKKPRKGKHITCRSLRRELYLTFSLGLPLEWAPGKAQDLGTLQNNGFTRHKRDMVKGFPFRGLRECQRNQRLHVGLPGPHSLSLERAPAPVLTRLPGCRRSLLEAVYSKSQTALGSHC